MTHLENLPKPLLFYRSATTASPGASPADTDTLPAIPTVPEAAPYMRDVYSWAYINPRNVHLLDHELVVSAILWGNHRQLQKAAFDEIPAGATVLQPACVYGLFSPSLAAHIGAEGHLDVVDVTPIQVASVKRKLQNFSHTTVRLGDSKYPAAKQYDVVCCYFLFHELPIDYKQMVVNALLASVRPGGKVVFVDYHKPHWAHPIKPITSLVFDTLEPFAKQLWRYEIADFADHAEAFSWKKDTYLGGLFQRTVAVLPQ